MITSATKLNVRYQETDKMGIVYHSNYLIWFEIGRTGLFNKMGISYAELEQKGHFLVVTEAYCKYNAPATYDNEIAISTRLAELKNSSLVFDYEVRKGDRLIAGGKTKHAFVNSEGKIARIPPMVTEAVNKYTRE